EKRPVIACADKRTPPHYIICLACGQAVARKIARLAPDMFKAEPMSSFVERRGIIASPFGPHVFLIKRSWLRARNACAAAGTGGFVIHHIDHVIFTGRDRLNANVHNSVGATLARTFCGWNQHVASAPALVNEVDKLLFPTLESSLRPRAMGIILHKFHPGVDVQLAAVSAARQ